MNNALSMIKKNYVMHIVMAVLCVMVSFVGNLWLGMVLGIAIYAIYLVMQFGDGADRGERACTMTATVEKIQSEGRKPDDRMTKQMFSKKTAIFAFIWSSAPFFLLAVVNLILADPNSVNENTLGIVTRVVNLPVAWLTRIFTTMVGVDYTGALNAGETVFSSITHAGLDFSAMIKSASEFTVYSTAYDLHYLTYMRICFIPLSFLPSLAMLIGYLQGPRYRRKKLIEIQKGTRKKKKKLKVFNKTREPRRMKPEV
ncbi:MAG: hypothetical protein IJC48_08195 [Clostridia bacterium]|nr:hypothetical protein [Clostridia bacterium]MBQ4157678.1 hypothetical protein [Clostridia bacterium]